MPALLNRRSTWPVLVRRGDLVAERDDLALERDVGQVRGDSHLRAAARAQRLGLRHVLFREVAHRDVRAGVGELAGELPRPFPFRAGDDAILPAKLLHGASPNRAWPQALLAASLDAAPPAR